MTSATSRPWLQLQSESSFVVRAVAITNQIADPSALDNVIVKVGDSKGGSAHWANQECYTVTQVQSGKTVSYPCSRALSGKFVLVWLHGSSRVLTVCEIIVYGERAKG